MQKDDVPFISNYKLPIALHLEVGPGEIFPSTLAYHLELSIFRSSLGNHVVEI